MNLRYFSIIGSISVLAAGGALVGAARGDDQEQGVEELTKGPVHEAFAATVSYDPEPGIIVKTAPPAMIEEVPPDQRPEGDNVTWIPGYWGWDADQNDFIWISGVWRNLPPGRQWVPGYWADLGGQWQWTSGYWADQQTEEVAYLPQPPKSIETGPNVAAPSVDDIWVSGNWIMRDDRYAWRPGYWEPGRPNWIWIPAHYQWTFRGYIFIDGYWDYNMERRGVLFAPVHFHHGFFNRPGFFYTPGMVISLNVFLNHLFIRPHYGHYYFGDYYSPRYRNDGFFASFSYESGRHGYDPIFSYNRWEHRHESGWERARRDDFAFYRDHKDARPPGTWAALQALPEGKRGGLRDHFAFAQPLKSYAMNAGGGQHFTTLSKDSRDKIVSQNHEIRKFGQDRLKLENHPSDKSAGGPGHVTRETFSKSPVLGKRADQFTGNDAPPKLHPSHNPNITLPDGKGTGRGGDTGKNIVIPEKTDIPNRKNHGDLIQPGKNIVIPEKTDIPNRKNHGDLIQPGKNIVIPEKTDIPNRKNQGDLIQPGKNIVIPEKTDIPNRKNHGDLIQPGKNIVIPEKTPRIERQTVDPTPRIERKTVDPTPRIERRTVDPTPRIERQTVDPTPRIERQTVQPTPRIERQTVQPTPRIERQTVTPAPGQGNPRKNNDPNADDKSKGR